MLTEQAKAYLRCLADKYETPEFLREDPAQVMHRVEGFRNREMAALLASVLSYGNRTVFMPKIEHILQTSGGNIYDWVLRGDFEKTIPDTSDCFYRLHTYGMMHAFLQSTRRILEEYGTMANYLSEAGAHEGLPAIEAIVSLYASTPTGSLIPKNTHSCCKRLCMLLRWMVRTDSPVDLGLWSDIIDRRTLIIPMDTHVMQQATALKLIRSKSTTMTAARKLTSVLLQVFPDDPLKADFALFGLDTAQKKKGYSTVRSNS